MPLAALLYLMTVLSTLKTKVNRFSFGWTLFSEALLLATFSCRGGWPLILLLVLSTVPPWFELRYRRRETTRVYTLYMGLFVASLVIGWLLIPAHPKLEQPPGLPVLIGGALLTFAALIRSGIAPLHSWLTDLFDRATFGTALLYVAPMPGAYIVMRLILPIAPTWALQSIAIVSLVSSVYASAMSLVQSDSRRFFCFLLLSNSSLVLVGMESANEIGITGGAVRLAFRGTVVKWIRAHHSLHRSSQGPNLLLGVPWSVRTHTDTCRVVLAHRTRFDWLSRYGWIRRARNC